MENELNQFLLVLALVSTETFKNENGEMKMMEIIDNNGTIHSGCEDDMRVAFAAMTDDVDYFETEEAFNEAKENYDTEWDGDLKLIKVVEVAR